MPLEPMDILFVRHGESEANVAGIIQGRGDYGLSPAGRAQAQRTAGVIADFKPEAVFASPLKRARETARLLMQGDDDITILDDLVEYNLGAFEGMTVREIFERFPSVLPALKAGAPFHLLAPGGEKDEDVDRRAERALGRILGAGRSRVLVVSHLGILERLIVALLPRDGGWRELDWPLRNCSLTRVRAGAGGSELQAFNDVSHLGVGESGGP